jgi:hypothetical protein
MIRCWRHLSLLKRAGRLLVDGGSESTSDGELALSCPACPHPGVNLPTGWDVSLPWLRFAFPAKYYCMILLTFAFRFRYNLFTMEDCNFRLFNLARTNLNIDLPLGSGWAYGVHPSDLRRWIALCTHPDEVY